MTLVKKTKERELEESIQLMQNELKVWEGREMQSWIGKWGRSLMITKLKKEIAERKQTLSELLSIKRR